MTDYQHEEAETDRVIDEWHERQPGMTQAEIMDAIKRVSKDIEALDDAQRVQPDVPGAAA